ncbi:hypothetical protein F5Y19DRAFT_461369 [Xylariaceae sp. FL1651]|nr:hypothetical protein F5Y19DRAFT_461369 [Xylariaceae sp. FL1651]
MRGSKPVCLLCRLQVATATAKTRAVQWQTKAAGFSSASQKLDAASAIDAATQVSNDATVSESTANQSPPYVRRILSESHRTKSNVKISPAKATRKIGEQTSSRVDALFQQIIHEQQGLQDAASQASLPVEASIDLSLVRAIGKLQEMVNGNTPVADAYLYFRTEIKPAIQAPGVHVPQAYHRVKFALMEKVIAAKKADMLTEKLPTVADIFRIYAEEGELKPKQWAMLVGKLVECIVSIEDPLAEAQSILKHERQLALREAMLADLIESWKVLSLPRLAIVPTGENELTKGFWFPRLDKFSLVKFARKGNFPAAFSTVFPQYPRNQLGAPVAVLAIATYALMHDSKRCSINVRRDASRFMSKVAYLIALVEFRDKALQRELINTFPRLEKYVMGLWPKIKAYLKQNGASEDDPSTEMYTISVPTDNNRAARAFNAASIGRRLSYAHGTRNSGELDRLWEEFVGPEKAISDERAAQIRQHPELIDSFIKIRMAFNQPDQAIVAWGLLSKVGLRPTLRTWNLMLDGLRKAGNVDGIKNIWGKLVASGLKLDTAIWTTRVAGLIEAGDTEGGLRALEEMAQLWKKSVANEYNAAVKPSIEPVNAALTGLIRCKQLEVAESLLAWAGRQGIQPDVITFNTMLRPLVRDGNRSGDVQKLFAAMQDQGVHANEATFTIVLDAYFTKNEIPDPEAQAAVVADVASAMTAAGLELNMQTYGKMLHLLLRANSTAAAMAVVSHLYARNLELSPHIYTMLVEHCFAQNPPALDSVHLIVQRRRYLDFDDMDRIFYDRVIKGYVLVGEIHAALEVYSHVVGSGASLGLGTLNDLLRALLRQERLDDARNLVNEEKKRFENQHQNPNEHLRYWGHQFWQLATRYSLLDSKLSNVTDVRQVNRVVTIEKPVGVDEVKASEAASPPSNSS